MARQTDPETFERFRNDAKFLITLYANAKMDAKLGFGGNLSGYVNGHKRPSVEKIEKFYELYGKDLEYYQRKVPDSIEAHLVRKNEEALAFQAVIMDIGDNLKEIKDMLGKDLYGKAIAGIRDKVDEIEKSLTKKAE